MKKKAMTEHLRWSQMKPRAECPQIPGKAKLPK